MKTMENKTIKGVEMVYATKLNGVYNMYLPKHRADRPEWYTPKGWEKIRLQSMDFNLGIKDIIFYIGAEEGEMPALCQIWGAKVVLFEPNRLVWPNAGVIWEANELEMPLASFAGFASNKTEMKEEKIYLRSFPECVNGKVIDNHGFKELKYEADVIPQIKIDDFVEKTGIIPTAISLDVEGSEWEVLQGAENTLRNYKPKIWLSLHPEFMFDQYKKYSYEVRMWLMDMGYKETLLDYQHEAHFYYE